MAQARSSTPRTLAAPARHDRSQLDDVVVPHHLVGGDQVVPPDDEHGLGQDVELAQHVLHPAVAGHLDLAPGIAQHDLHRHLRTSGTSDSP